MSAFIWILLFTVSTSDSLSIGVNQNVTKRETNANFFPDWVPFKNKHGADLGEFVDVAKSKPKKRLALPVNFKLKAVVETEGDDYFDKGLGGSDNDDNYDKKEWSDQHRSANVVDLKKPINHTDISDIDGIVNIITKPSNDPVLKLLKQRRKTSKQRDKIKRKNEEAKPKKESKESVEEEVIPKKESEKSAKEKVVPKKETEESAKEEIVPKKETEEIVIEVNDKNDTIEESESKNEEIKQEKSIEKSEEETEEDESKEEIKNDKENVQKIEENKEVQKKNEEKDDADDEETSADKEKEEAEKTEKQRENDEKKAKILSSVDELKERHAEEQRSLSEKIKEEELFEEELERELERTGTKRNDDDDKYAHPGSRWKKITEDFDEYEDQEGSLNDKYKINSFETTTTTISPKKTGKRKQKSNKIGTNGKLSVFRNPNLYTVNDEEDYSTTTSKPKKIRMRKPEKFSSKYSAQADEDKDNVRISLVPVDNDSKEGEPTLFFPKKRNSKRRFKIKTTTTPIPDTTADSSEEKSDLTDVTPTRTDYTETGPSASDAYSSASNTAPSAETGPDDTAPSASAVSDTAQASTEKKGKKKKSDDYHRETGGEKEHHSEHDEVNEEHGKKAYEGVHKDTKTNKGHHDKEKHLDKYDDHGGIDKHHHKEDNHYGSHHHEEHGKKHAKYEESGKHSKGHSTKGSHDIHKKEEYEKKVEFFEEDGDSDDEENEGGYHSNKEHSSGGHFKKGDLNAGYEGHSKGETGEFAKGGHVHVNKGHKASGGHDSHLKKGDGHHKKELQDKGKKWVYHHGHPAKTANLVIIDRRADAYMHGPRYFG